MSDMPDEIADALDAMDRARERLSVPSSVLDVETTRQRAWVLRALSQLNDLLMESEEAWP